MLLLRHEYGIQRTADKEQDGCHGSDASSCIGISRALCKRRSYGGVHQHLGDENPKLRAPWPVMQRLPCVNAFSSASAVSDTPLKTSYSCSVVYTGTAVPDQGYKEHA